MTPYPSRPLPGIGRHRNPVQPSWPVTVAILLAASLLICGGAAGFVVAAT
jgi:hypothetical protein